MPRVVPGGRAGWIGQTSIPWADFGRQLRAISSALAQLIGNANIADGGTESADPITAPFQLYVDFDIGRDTFVAGDFNWFEITSPSTDEEIIAQKLRRLRNQRLECGYSKHAPFKTLNRAVLEAAIITSLNWYTYTDPRAHRDCVIIHMGAGPQPLYNYPGTHASAVAIAPWADGKVPTWQELIAFNDNTLGGVILPRGAAFSGEDLRKTVFVPQWAPAPANIAADYSNIRCAIYLTPDVHAVDFTFRDPPGQSQSAHLLYGLGFPSQAQLNQFYGKVQAALGTSANLSSALLQARTTEYEVVGPFASTPSIAWDTVSGASAYPERISLRSVWGMGGIFIDGDQLGGLKSTVTAQFTGVSLQTDVNCLQIYSGGAWVTPANYQAYIDASPDNRRIRPERMHCHILAINEAFVSEVSVFGVGHTARVRADSGAEVVSSNGNFTFGSCAAYATRYRRVAFPQDRNWLVDKISVPLSPGEKTPSIRKIALGVVFAHNASSITLVRPLAADASGSLPLLLSKDGFSLPSGTYVWVENPDGDDWRAQVTGSAWSSSTPAQINITAALTQAGTNDAVPLASGVSKANGKQVYVRRLVDSRTASERRASLQLATSAGSRTPVKAAVLQTSPGVAGGAISRALQADGEEVLIVTQSLRLGASGAQVTVRRGCPSRVYTVGQFYRKGTTVRALNKHWIALRDVYAVAATPPSADWDEVYVHMPEAYNPAERDFNEAPQIVFDTDTDPNDNTATCGINWSTAFTAAGRIRDQYRSGSDVLGIYAFLRALGFSDAAAWAALAPQAAATRLLDPTSATDFPTAPSGGAATGLARWAVEFRRPTTITLSNFTYDLGMGRGNYSTALPSAQKTLSPSNQFSLYFTAGFGGRVVARGVNEEGQEVTIRGLTEAETGETILAGDVAGGEEDAPTNSFSDIGINGLIGTGVWDLSGVSTLILPSVSPASTTAPGPVRLASAAALRGNNVLSGATDEELNASIEATPDVVTQRALEYWARYKGVLFRRTGLATLYVVPDNAVNAGTYNFDGTSVALVLDPQRTGAALFDSPPTTQAAAVTFTRAVEYANTVYGQYETVNYQLANGPYWRQPAAFQHIANVIGAAARFPTTNVVTSYTSASTKPATNVKALHDARTPFLIPVFATSLLIVNAIDPLSGAGYIYCLAKPVTLNFPYGGSARAICELSVGATLADTTNFPSDPIYVAASRPYRTAGISIQNFIDNYIDALVPNTASVLGFWNDYNFIVGDGNFLNRDIIYGAKATGLGNTGVGLGPNIHVVGDAVVSLAGIYLMGNSQITALPKATAKSVAFGNIIGCRNTQGFLGTHDANNPAARKIALKFQAPASINPTAAGADRNLDSNCIHILDDNGNYGLLANRAATNGTRGAAMEAFVHLLNYGSTLITGGFDSWQVGYTPANKQPGVAGTFGNDASTGAGPFGILPQAFAQHSRQDSYTNCLWQLATTGAVVNTNITLTPAAGQSQQSYSSSNSNNLNMKVQAFFRGVDANSATSVIGSLPVDPGGANNTPKFFG